MSDLIDASNTAPGKLVLNKIDTIRKIVKIKGKWVRLFLRTVCSRIDTMFYYYACRIYCDILFSFFGFKNFY